MFTHFAKKQQVLINRHCDPERSEGEAISNRDCFVGLRPPRNDSLKVIITFVLFCFIFGSGAVKSYAGNGGADKLRTSARANKDGGDEIKTGLVIKSYQKKISDSAPRATLPPLTKAVYKEKSEFLINLVNKLTPQNVNADYLIKIISTAIGVINSNADVLLVEVQSPNVVSMVTPSYYSPELLLTDLSTNVIRKTLGLINTLKLKLEEAEISYIEDGIKSLKIHSDLLLPSIPLPGALDSFKQAQNQLAQRDGGSFLRIVPQNVHKGKGSSDVGSGLTIEQLLALGLEGTFLGHTATRERYAREGREGLGAIRPSTRFDSIINDRIKVMRGFVTRDEFERENLNFQILVRQFIEKGYLIKFVDKDYVFEEGFRVNPEFVGLDDDFKDLLKNDPFSYSDKQIKQIEAILQQALSTRKKIKEIHLGVGSIWKNIEIKDEIRDIERQLDIDFRLINLADLQEVNFNISYEPSRDIKELKDEELKKIVRQAHQFIYNWLVEKYGDEEINSIWGKSLKIWFRGSVIKNKNKDNATPIMSVKIKTKENKEIPGVHGVVFATSGKEVEGCLGVAQVVQDAAKRDSLQYGIDLQYGILVNFKSITEDDKDRTSPDEYVNQIYGAVKDGRLDPKHIIAEVAPPDIELEKWLTLVAKAETPMQAYAKIARKIEEENKAQKAIGALAVLRESPEPEKPVIEEKRTEVDTLKKVKEMAQKFNIPEEKRADFITKASAYLNADKAGFAATGGEQFSSLIDTMDKAQVIAFSISKESKIGVEPGPKDDVRVTISLQSGGIKAVRVFNMGLIFCTLDEVAEFITSIEKILKEGKSDLTKKEDVSKMRAKVEDIRKNREPRGGTRSFIASYIDDVLVELRDKVIEANTIRAMEPRALTIDTHFFELIGAKSVTQKVTELFASGYKIALYGPGAKIIKDYLLEVPDGERANIITAETEPEAIAQLKAAGVEEKNIIPLEYSQADGAISAVVEALKKAAKDDDVNEAFKKLPVMKFTKERAKELEKETEAVKIFIKEFVTKG